MLVVWSVVQKNFMRDFVDNVARGERHGTLVYCVTVALRGDVVRHGTSHVCCGTLSVYHQTSYTHRQKSCAPQKNHTLTHTRHPTQANTMSRRRLSGGAALLAPGLDDGSSDEEAAPAPKLANKNRRRSGARRSFGGRKSGGKTMPVDDLSAEDVAAMYSTTLKMAAVDDRVRRRFPFSRIELASRRRRTRSRRRTRGRCRSSTTCATSSRAKTRQIRSGRSAP